MLKVTPRGESIILYFDEKGAYLGIGSSSDRIHFKWISREDERQHPDQIVDPKRWKQMVQDVGGKLVLKPKN